MAIVTYTDDDGVHYTDEHSKAYENHQKAQATKPDVKESPRLDPPKPVAKVDVKPEHKAL